MRYQIDYMSDNDYYDKEYYTHIESKRGLLDIDLKEILYYKDLIILLTKKSFILTYKQTILGPAWIIINPLITSFIYVVVFGKIAGMSTNGAPQLLFYLGGNAVWTYFATCVNKTAVTFTANANVFGKVYFPRLCVPISTVISAGINFGVQMTLFSVLWVYYILAQQVRPNFFAIPAIVYVLFQLGALGLASGIIVSAMTTKYRDLVMLISFGVQLWMYATPVVYPLSQLAPGTSLYKVIQINPITCSMELFRYAFLGEGIINVFYVLCSLLMTIVLLTIGVLLFNRVENTFMDTV